MKKTSSVLTSLLSAAAVLFTPAKATAELSETQARARLKQGALVVDVRSAEEFKARRLPNTINLPLPELKEKIASVAPDKNQVLLLHCQSGKRSGTAERQLRELGYTNAFNLGSFSRAEKILQNPGK